MRPRFGTVAARIPIGKQAHVPQCTVHVLGLILGQPNGSGHSGGFGLGHFFEDNRKSCLANDHRSNEHERVSEDPANYYHARDISNGRGVEAEGGQFT